MEDTQSATHPSTDGQGKMVSEAQETHAAFSHLFIRVCEPGGEQGVRGVCWLGFSSLLGLGY